MVLARVVGRTQSTLSSGPASSVIRNMPMARADQTAGERRLREQHERIQWIAVPAQGVVDEPVVGRVLVEVKSVLSSRIRPEW